MKFVCLICDAQMKNVDAERQREHGTMSIVLECPECFGRVGLLTNPMETKVLDSLDVSVCPVGGRGRHEEVTAAASSASSSTASVTWSPEAEARMKIVPVFVRPMARRGVEAYARSNGHSVITPEILEAARKAVGM